jgi:hypothetical protein
MKDQGQKTHLADICGCHQVDGVGPTGVVLGQLQQDLFVCNLEGILHWGSNNLNGLVSSDRNLRSRDL